VTRAVNRDPAADDRSPSSEGFERQPHRGCIRSPGDRAQHHAVCLRRARVLLLGALTSLLLATATGVALADGDPASDILATQSFSVSPEAGATPDQIAKLKAVLDASAHAGYPIRVAVIASAADLGSIGSLWHQPQAYADYIGLELSEVARGRVLVVMPNGFGLYQPGVTPAGDQTQLTRTPAPPASHSLAVVAARGVENLAAASGHPIPSSTIHVTAVKAPRPQGTSLTTWLAWLVGAALILVAWTLSLRARPPGLKGQLPAAG
jgi:hypothetical protein